MIGVARRVRGSGEAMWIAVVTCGISTIGATLEESDEPDGTLVGTAGMAIGEDGRLVGRIAPTGQMVS